MSVHLIVRISGLNRVQAVINVLKRKPIIYLFLPWVLLLGANAVSEILGRILMKLFVKVEQGMGI